MRLDRSELSKAVQTALSLGVVAAVGAAGTAMAQNATTTQNSQQQPQTLQTIVVTGSHIRRVDLETSNPVVAVTSQQIEATGKMTLGDVLQKLPVIAGAMTNPNVNNSGGSGSTAVGLRGLGASRTLVLVDGQRLLYGQAGTSTIQDLNFIPASAVERIEVLTDGASAVYGSDAIGGVINIILKSDYQGAQFQANYGISDHNDAERKGGSFIFGQTSDKGSILAGVDYQKFDQLLQSSRKFSQDAISLSTSNGVPFASIGGSTFAARDSIRFADPTIAPAFGGGAGCNNLSLNQSAADAGTSPTGPGDYHCFTNADKYNYASVNLIMTPNERTSGFFKGVYHLTDNVDLTATYVHQKTVAQAQLAPAVYGSLAGAYISKDSYYNPFGVDFTPSNGNDFRARLFPAGNRIFHNAVTKDQAIVGLKGNLNLGSQNWTWDVGYNYGHFSRISSNLGFPNLQTLNQETGPSFMDPTTGQVVCGTPGNIIANCTPFDPFNQYSPNTAAVEQAASAPSVTDTYYISRNYHADVSGGLFDLPAGTVQLAGGISYTKQYTNNVVGPLILIENQPPYSCPLGSACTSHLQGGFDVKEAYAEVFIPVLKDMPFVRSLNVTLGDRYSKYNTVGGTNNWKLALEYRPIDDLLLRGTVTTVFRAPSIANLYGPPTSSAPRLTYDPCSGMNFTPAPGTGPALACQGVPTDGSYVDFYTATGQQLTAVNGGAQFFHVNLKPESGKTFDLGAVYSPHFVPGLSLSADFWRVYLNNIITNVGVQTSLIECYNGVLSFCPNVASRAGGDPLVWIQPIANLGRIDAKGIDFSGNYKLPQFSFGQFDIGLQGTYMQQFKINTAPQFPQGTLVLNGVGNMGTFGSALGSSCPFNGAGGVCFFPRIRATGTLGWQLGPWDAQWTMRYYSKFKGGSADPSQYSTMGLGNGQALRTEPAIVIHYGATVYNNLQVGYNIEPIHTRIDVGIDNMFDKQPPFLYANNSLNANTDPEDFDVVGRYYWGRVTVKF